MDAAAETEADAAIAASGQRLVPVYAPRGHQLRRSLLAALAIAVLISVIVIERHTLAETLQVLTKWPSSLTAARSPAAPPPVPAG